jgi:hypothetical protein
MTGKVCTLLLAEDVRESSRLEERVIDLEILDAVHDRVRYLSFCPGDTIPEAASRIV